VHHSQSTTPKRSATPAPSEPGPSSGATSDLAGGLGFNPAASAALDQIVGQAGASDDPPAYLIRIYKAAARRYHIRWEILAAINAIESDYGRDLKTSSSGAVGWMQFMPDTWRAYATAARRRKPDPYDPHDAIFAAAHLLAANGGMRDIRQALFAF
jgi:soluble lytic murein transglycosylase-like protein